MENEKIKTKWKNSKNAITFGCVLKAHLLEKRGERTWKIKENMKNYWNCSEIKEYSKNIENNCLNASCGIVMGHAEAVTQRCSVKNLFIEISQNSQQNTCGRVVFASLSKRNTGTGVFFWILWNFLELLFLQSTSSGCFWTRKIRLTRSRLWFTIPECNTMLRIL